MRHAGTEARILAAAAAAFASRGYAATTMKAIAIRAGMSVGLLYRYSASKEALFVTAFERTTEAALARLVAGRAPAADAGTRLQAGEAWLADQLAGAAWPALRRQAWAASATNPRIRRATRRQARILDSLAADWAGQAAGESPIALRAEQLALAARMLLDGAIAHDAEQRAPGQAAALARAAAAVLRSALRSTPRQAGSDVARTPRRS